MMPLPHYLVANLPHMHAALRTIAAEVLTAALHFCRLWLTLQGQRDWASEVQQLFNNSCQHKQQ